jgi:hypothetical protein
MGMGLKHKIRQIVDVAWVSYKNKVASGLLSPENEKMMQLQFALTLQSLVPIFEYDKTETIKILLEVPVTIKRVPSKRIIDIVILHSQADKKIYYPVELKCFRLFTRDNLDKKRGGQNLGMYDYWADIENVEQYCLFDNYGFGTQLTLTDDPYYVVGKHLGPQVIIYSTNNSREGVAGKLQQDIPHRQGLIELVGKYDTTIWEKLGDFYFIRQEIEGGDSE